MDQTYYFHHYEDKKFDNADKRVKLINNKQTKLKDLNKLLIYKLNCFGIPDFQNSTIHVKIETLQMLVD